MLVLLFFLEFTSSGGQECSYCHVLTGSVLVTDIFRLGCEFHTWSSNYDLWSGMPHPHYLLLAATIFAILYCRRLVHLYQALQVYIGMLLIGLKAHANSRLTTRSPSSMDAFHLPESKTRDLGAWIDSSKSFVPIKSRAWWSSFFSTSGKQEAPFSKSFLVLQPLPRLSLQILRPYFQRNSKVIEQQILDSTILHQGT